LDDMKLMVISWAWTAEAMRAALAAIKTLSIVPDLFVMLSSLDFVRPVRAVLVGWFCSAKTS
jgi:hypothetical protein